MAAWPAGGGQQRGHGRAQAGPRRAHGPIRERPDWLPATGALRGPNAPSQWRRGRAVQPCSAA